MLPDVESIEIFDNKHFSDKFSDFVKSTIEKEVEKGVERGSGELEQHVQIEIDLVNVRDTKHDSWWFRTWRKIKSVVVCPFKWLWHKTKAGGLHLAIKFDGMMADFKDWKTNFKL